MDTDFKLWETHLAGRLGISRDTMRELRGLHLVEHQDWSLVKNRVLLTDAAAGKIAAALRLSVPETARVIESAATPEKPAERPTVTLRVWRTTRNPHIIEAYLPETDPAHRDAILRVRVKNAANFCRIGGDGQPMTLKAAHLQADLYELVGPCPRRKGRW